MQSEILKLQVQADQLAVHLVILQYRRGSSSRLSRLICRAMARADRRHYMIPKRRTSEVLRIEIDCIGI